jgi:hypothetical protein
MIVLFILVSMYTNLPDIEHDDEKTHFTWTDSSGVVHPVLLSAEGRCYVLKTKNGQEYKFYLDSENSEKIKSEIKDK